MLPGGRHHSGEVGCESQFRGVKTEIDEPVHPHLVDGSGGPWRL